ncbi:MAG: hypothetical protein JOY72_04525 [Actinobacteria bacterium]|nr:hypothetical protein [Actinomycetota bacterium]
MSERAFSYRPWLLAAALRPVLFALAIAAAVIAGEKSNSFWIGLLAYIVARFTGRAIRRLLRNRWADAVYELLWAAAAVGYAILFVDVSIPKWASVIVAVIAAGITRNVLASAFLPRRRGWTTLQSWGVPGPDDVIVTRWTVRRGPR